MIELEKKQISDQERERRLSDYELRLKTLHQMRWSLLQIAHDIKEDHTKCYDDEFYVEANEIINEVERKVWKYINGEVDEY